MYVAVITHYGGELKILKMYKVHKVGTVIANYTSENRA